MAALVTGLSFVLGQHRQDLQHLAPSGCWRSPSRPPPCSAPPLAPRVLQLLAGAQKQSLQDLQPVCGLPETGQCDCTEQQGEPRRSREPAANTTCTPWGCLPTNQPLSRLGILAHLPQLHQEEALTTSGDAAAERGPHGRSMSQARGRPPQQLASAAVQHQQLQPAVPVASKRSWHLRPEAGGTKSEGQSPAGPGTPDACLAGPPDQPHLFGFSIATHALRGRPAEHFSCSSNM